MPEYQPGTGGNGDRHSNGHKPNQASTRDANIDRSVRPVIGNVAHQPLELGVFCKTDCDAVALRSVPSNLFIRHAQINIPAAGRTEPNRRVVPLSQPFPLLGALEFEFPVTVQNVHDIQFDMRMETASEMNELALAGI